VHPYDDLGVIAGQGTLALELLQDVPDLDALVIPVGGGGLLAGCATVARAMKPGIAVFGVEVANYSAMAQRLAGETVSVGGATIAEGIAVRDIGEQPFEIVRKLGVEVLVVPEHTVEEAIGLLVEGAKVVAEGAGATGVAALLAYTEHFRDKRVGVAITGGNIDARILSNVLLRNLLRTGGYCDCICKSPIDRACSRISPARSATPAATSSRFPTSACSPRLPYRRRNSR